jgi:hypothetical protein
VMFMLCAMALVLRTDRAVEQGGSVLQKVSQPAKPVAPIKAPVTAPNPAQTGGQSPISQPPPQVPPANSTTPAPAPKKP